MEKISKQVELLQEQNAELQSELQDCQSKIVSLDEQLIHRNAQLSKLEDELLESKMRCRKADEESSNYRIKVGTLEDEIAKSNIRVIQVEKEFLKSKEKIVKLEARCDKLEAINELLEKLKDDQTLAKIIATESRKERAQAEKEEKEPVETKPLDLPHIDGEDSLNAAFLKCQKLVCEGRICLCQQDFIELLAHERKTGLEALAAGSFVTENEDDLEGVDELLETFENGEDYATATAKNEFIKMCRNNYSADSKIFYVGSLSDSTKILAITENTITEMKFDDKKVCRECKVDDLREIQLQDPDVLKLIVRCESSSWKSKCTDTWSYSCNKREKILDAIYGN